MATSKNTLLAALGFASVLIFKTDGGKKADGTVLYYRRPKDGNPGIQAGYRIVVPEHDNVSGLGAKLQATSGLEFIAAFLAVHGGEGEKTVYYQLRLFPNDRKTSDAQPAYRGFLETGNGEESVRVADASAFMKTDKNGHPFMSVALQEPYVKPEGESSESKDSAVSDGMPF
jgi:uncharacterized protein (DUF736 family)